ncbi:MAG: glycosyltransferase N-terminal domain-containing protein, partial [Phycisphaerales bacterium]
MPRTEHLLRTRRAGVGGGADDDVGRRIGHGDALGPVASGRILIHAVSVGEVNAIRTLVERLSAADPAPDVVVSATTDTGTARAKEVFGARHA